MSENIKEATLVEKELSWHEVGTKSDFPGNAGRCAKIEGKQIAIFYFKTQDKWYACQNLCPHKQEMVLARGLIGDKNGIPKVACPLHKNNFSLIDGSNLNGDLPDINTFPVKVVDDIVYLGL